MKIAELAKEIDKIKARNRRVEADKAWETSALRKLLILALTYIVVTVFFLVAKLPDPFANAFITSVTFVLSNMSVPFFKKLWIRKIYKKR